MDTFDSQAFDFSARNQRIMNNSIVLNKESESSLFKEFTTEGFDVPMVDGKKEGKGIEKLKKDDQLYTLECSWVNDKKEGEGMLLNSDDILAMKLHFKEGMIEGEGTLYDNGKVIFKGIWKNNQRCGLCQEFKNGHLIYKGEYAQDKRNGYGVEYNDNEEVIFDGLWEGGNQGRKCIKENSNGDRELYEYSENGKVMYIGGFIEGTVTRDGKGVDYDENENPIRISMYKDGESIRKIKEFKGEIITTYDSDGNRIYEGGYLKDTHHHYPANGKGKLYKDGIMVYNGEFKNGLREGHGCSYYVSHTLKYEGDWVKDKANGNGIFNDEEGMQIADGEWNDDIYTNGDIMIDQETGRTSKVKASGCFCAGSARKSQTKSLPSTAEEGSISNSINSLKELRGLPTTIKNLALGAGLSDPSVTSLSLYSFSQLQCIVIEDSALSYMSKFYISEFPKLQSIEIQRNALVLPENKDIANRKDDVRGGNKDFSIESCYLLEEIHIAPGACSDFSRVHILDLPELKVLEIGMIEKSSAKSLSSCFYWCKELKLQGFDKLESILLGGNCFYAANNVTIKDMPLLKSIDFGVNACCGEPSFFDEEGNKLVIRNLPSLTHLHCEMNAFHNFGLLEIVKLGALQDVKDVSIDSEGVLSLLKKVKHSPDIANEFLDLLKTGRKFSSVKLKVN